jgi:hypothetical protein
MISIPPPPSCHRSLLNAAFLFLPLWYISCNLVVA